MVEKAVSVILIHGLWMPGMVMLAHQHRLRAEGFNPRRFSYPSWRDGLTDNVQRLSRFVRETPSEIVHLVAHSLGGLVALTMLARNADGRIRRVVMMGSPYAGCHCGLTLAGIPVMSGLVGRTFQDWFGVPPPDLPPTIEIGIIAGTRRRGFGRLFPRLARPNDGLISVEETQIPTATDRIALDVCHSGMLISHHCTEQIVSFLRTGKFVRDQVHCRFSAKSGR